MNASAKAAVEPEEIRTPIEREHLSARGKPLLSLGIRLCTLTVFVVALYFAYRQGVASWYFRNNLPEGVATAAKWDPANPQYADTLANLIHFYSESPDPNRIVALCETATHLSPNDAHYWADLGSAYDWAGRPADAIRAFERARQLFPDSPDINWRLANYYVRTNRAPEALPLLKKVLLAGGVQDKQAFALVARTGINVTAITTSMLPPRGSVFVDYMNFQVESGDITAAGEAWAALLQSGVPFKVSDPFYYIDALIRRRNTDEAVAVWRGLAAQFPSEIRSRTSSPDLIVNGGFDFPILNGGFDWRVNPVQAVTVRINSTGQRNGAGSLQVDFGGAQNLAYGDTLQFVPVRPNVPYEFSAELRTSGITTDSGPRIQIYDQYDRKNLFVATEGLTGDVRWMLQKLSFRTSPSTRLIVVQVARPPSPKLDNKIAGTVWIRHVSLHEENQN